VRRQEACVVNAILQALPPVRTLVLYDGTCGLCDRTVRWLLDRDRRGRLWFAPLQGRTAEPYRRFAGLGTGRESLVLVEAAAGGARIFVEARAVARALRALEGPWALAGTVLDSVPAPLGNAVYRFVSRHRLHLGGASCLLAGPRFLP
jgi:predicted DCC family thiol-disulfide oxidoreductase YuxK